MTNWLLSGSLWLIVKHNYSAVKRYWLNKYEFLDLVQVFEYGHALPNCKRIDEQIKIVNQSFFNQRRIKWGTTINDDVLAVLTLAWWFPPQVHLSQCPYLPTAIFLVFSWKQPLVFLSSFWQRIERVIRLVHQIWPIWSKAVCHFSAQNNGLDRIC